MNPLGYYLSKNNDLKNKLLKTSEDYADHIPYPELKSHINSILREGTPVEIIQVASLMSCLRLYY